MHNVHRGLLMSVVLTVAVTASAQDLASFEKRISVKQLDNGLTLVVCERPVAPVFSFFTHVNVGAAQEVAGITGIAHMFEHMAFKGTDTVGTTDYAAESAALAEVEEAYAAWRREKLSASPDEAKLETLHAAFEAATKKAHQYVISNQFDEIMTVNGAVGMNAFTSQDETGYHYSLPANRLELWAFMESQRFLTPVFREFYKERDVVQEERRRAESNPIRRLVEQFSGTAFLAHPYQRPVLGWMSDLQSFSATDAKRFYEKYYVPANMVVTVVGDVEAAEVMPVLERYFSRLPAGPKPEELSVVEPPQNSERTVRLFDQSQPIYVEGYHRPDFRHPDNAVYQAISDILSNGRVSRLYRSLVRDKQIAAAAAGFSGLPGEKYPHLFAFFAIPTPDHTTDECRTALREEIARLKTELVSEEELALVKTRAKADLIRGLANNQGLAFQLGTYQAQHGDWRELFHSVDRIEKVSREDILRVAKATFVASNRTVGEVITTDPEESMETEEEAQ